MGAVGGLLGVVLGHALAAGTPGGDPRRGLLPRRGATAGVRPTAGLAYLLLGVAASCRRHWAAGACRSHRWRQRVPYAGERRAGLPRATVTAGRLGAAMLVPFAALACLLPPFGSIPLDGYAAVVFVLMAAILALPVLSRASCCSCSRAGAALIWRRWHARLAATPGNERWSWGQGVIASVPDHGESPSTSRWMVARPGHDGP